LLGEWRYTELRLMRPPLYGVFLAGNMLLFDSLVQNLRLVQAVISAATVVPVWLLTREIVRAEDEHTSSPAPATLAPLLAALLCALSYTLADYATELLTETLFLFGLTVLFWLLVRAGSPMARQSFTFSAAAAGVVLGLLCLTRSVALVLLPLGALWLLLAPTGGSITWADVRTWSRWRMPALFVLCAVLLIAPWTARNYATYGALIVIDTTGPENLWLDNDPAGREAVKAQLYALGEDMAARQQLATQRGLEAITSDPQRFAQKAGGELLAFFALEYTDDMLERPVIWVPPAEVWARLLLGDGLWLLLLLAGVLGLAQRVRLWPPAPAALLTLWALYTLLTALVFHVELRYRLPLYPVLLPYAALLLADAWQRVRGVRHTIMSRWRWLAGGTLAALVVALLLLHRPYPLLAWHLGWKHYHLGQAERYLDEGYNLSAVREARAALQHDPDSVLARVAWAQAAMQANDNAGAAEHLRAAMDLLPAHPLPHLLLGHLLREQGRLDDARRELAYETATLQDVQAWAWQWFSAPPPPMLDVGNGLDLGFIRGFHPAEAAAGLDWRWTTGSAMLRLGVPAAPGSTAAQAACAAHEAPALLRLRMASGRPADAPQPVVQVAAAGHSGERVQVAPEWDEYLLSLSGSATAGESVIIHLRSETFSPRDYNPTSSDGRTLGVMLDRAEIILCNE
jgi:4-amino-4-deoxy-L-arabinose transferase-like glycosyltransferase